MVMFVGQSDARMAWMQGQQQQDMENRRAQHEQRMRDKAQRDQAAADQAEMAQRERMQGQAIAASQASQSFAANRASSDAYNARNDAYSAATDPRLAAVERLRQNEAMGRDAALMGVQSGNRINEHFEGMLDDRARQMGVANNQARLDSALTMQRGNIDARLQGQQGQNAMSLHQYDAVSKAEADLRNKEMAIQERNGQMMQTGQFSEGDQTYLQGLEEQKQNLRTARDEKRITDTQYISGMHSLLTKEAGRLPTQKRVSFGEQFEQSSKMLPDGRIVYHNGKGVDISPPPAGVKPEMVDPEAKAAKAQAELEKLASTIQKNSGFKPDPGDPSQTVPRMDFRQAMQEAANLRRIKDGQYEVPSQTGSDPQELFRHVQTVNQMAAQSGVPVQQYLGGLKKRAPEAAAAYEAGIRLIQQSQGGGGADPRSGAMQPGVGVGHQSQGQPVQKVEPGRPGPTVDPRMGAIQKRPVEAQGRDARADVIAGQPVDQATLERWRGVAKRSGDDRVGKLIDLALKTRKPEVAEAVNSMMAAFEKLPAPGTIEYEKFGRAARTLELQGFDFKPRPRPRPAPAMPDVPVWRRPSPSSRNLAE